MAQCNNMCVTDFSISSGGRTDVRSPAPRECTPCHVFADTEERHRGLSAASFAVWP